MVPRFDRVIPPGGEGKITLELSTRGYQGSLQKSADVYSNDPRMPQIKLVVKAFVAVPISYEPRATMLTGQLGEDITQVITIKAHKEKPLTLEPVSFTVPDKVGYEIKTIEEGRVFEVVLKNIWNKPGKYSGFLTFKTNYPEQPELKLGFIAYLKSVLEIQPASIAFRHRGNPDDNSKKKSENILPKRSVMLSLLKGNDLKIEKIEINEKLFKKSVNEIEAGKKYRIDLELNTKNLPSDGFDEVMKIYTNVKDDPVKILPIKLSTVKKTSQSINKGKE